MPKVIDLPNLDSRDGFLIQGDAPGDNAGWSVSGAGDVNGDGIADLIVGAPDADDKSGTEGNPYATSEDYALSAGKAYVIFGRDLADGGAAFGTIDLGALDPADGFIIQGGGTWDPDYPDDRNTRTGFSVSGAGDVNGDGIDDLIVGGPDQMLGSESRGAAYVIFGRDVAGGAEPFGTIEVDAHDTADSIQFRGNIDYDFRHAWDREGYSVSGAGDVNGDGFDDLIIGAPKGDRGGINAGEAYVVFGGDLAALTNAYGSVSLYGLGLGAGFIIQGDAAGDAAARSVSDAGDVNGDGIADLIVGAPNGDDGGDRAGEAYVIFGRDVAGGADAFTNIDLTALDPTDGFTIQGGSAGNRAGFSVSNAGDVNGDGIDDLIVGASGPGSSGIDDASGSEPGVAYVVYGRDVAGGADAFGTIDLAALDPADGFVIERKPTGDNAGVSVSSAGDVNGDGIDDLIVGAPGAKKAYVIYGRDVAGGADPFATVDFGNLLRNEGFIIDAGGLGRFAAFSVSGVGDINGDGFDDVIVGAADDLYDGRGFYSDYSDVSGPGAAYVIYGKPVPEIRGDGSANTLEGGPDDEVLWGLGGNDLLNGGAGDDLLFGGADDDVLRGSQGADVLFGDSGNDTLFGGAGDDALNGGSGDDVIDGREGNDFLRGNQGADRLIGGAGDDGLKGGLGQDTLEGGAGNDRFHFQWVSHSPADAGDTIADFETGDRIVLTPIDADTTSPETDEAFVWLADAAFSGSAGELRYEVSGGDALVQGDVDGDGLADLEISLTGVSALTPDDFGGDPMTVDLRGDASANALLGYAGVDVLRGFAGDDLLEGKAGDDLLYGGDGDDDLRGGIGADHVYGNAGNDTLIGGEGLDRLYGGSGDDLLEGGAGRDFLIGRQGADRIHGGDGLDKIKGGLGQDALVGGAGSDRFLFSAVDHSPAGAGDTIADFETGDRLDLDRIDADVTSAATHETFTWIGDAAFTGSAGELRYEVSGGDAVVQGDIDGDGAADLEITLTGVSALTAADFAGDPMRVNLRGDASANTLFGYDANDILRGMGGADLLEGMAGDDVLRGGSGHDTLFGGSGQDTLYGGAGNDVLNVKRGENLLYGGEGDDHLTGAQGYDDRLYGNEGNDTLIGGDRGADDWLEGGLGDDVLRGGGGDDILLGNEGADRIDGGSGKDRITAGLGQDYLEGGDKKDRFIYGSVEHSRPDASDTIADFESPDLIVLDGIDADATSAATNEAFTLVGEAVFTNTAGELRYEFSGGDAVVQGDVDGDGAADLEIVLIGVSSFAANDFVL